MRILGIDTSTQTGGVAIVEDNRLLSEFILDVISTHSRRILSSIDIVLKNSGLSLHDIDAFAVGAGPGSFTGLRIGAATIKGLAYSLSKPIIGISSLLSLSMNVICSPIDIRPVLVSRKNELYTALFKTDSNKLIRLEKDTALSIQEIISRINKPTYLIGNGLLKYGELFTENNGKFAVLGHPSHHQIRPSMVAFLGSLEFMSGKIMEAADFLPCYIKHSDAEINWDISKCL